MIRDKEISDLINATYDVLHQSIQFETSNDESKIDMQDDLDSATYRFSGFKAYHQMNETAFAIKTEDGGIESYAKFREKVKAIDNAYNENYLRTEYNLFQNSSTMADKWTDIEQDGDRYDLQYRTAGDDKVREEHARLDGTTLPANDPFWDSYYPPNGYNCRCTAVQVRKNKYPTSNSKEAIALGNSMTEGKQSIFRWNPGKSRTPYPTKHPYMPTGCGDCEYSTNLALNLKQDKCKVCRNLSANYERKVKTSDITKQLKDLKSKTGSEYVKALKDICKLKSFGKIEDGIYFSGSKNGNDYDNLLNGARKAVSHGYTAYILPNPNSTRTADYILLRKNFAGMYDLKTITGKSSVSNRLNESVGQANRVVLNMVADYNPRILAVQIKRYFESNMDAQEILVFKGRKLMQVHREDMTKIFVKSFCKEYTK